MADPAHNDTIDEPMTDVGPPDAEAEGDGLSLPPAELAAGTRIGGRYVVIRRIGAGGMGAVYEAEHEQLQRRVALKVLHPEYGRNASAVERFVQEGRAVNAVRHRHVVEVMDLGADEGRPWLVMELLDGESLGARIEREGGGDPEWAVRTIDPVCRALHQAHLRGFIHRDVKPDNVFLAREAGVSEVVPKVLDFGVARNLASVKRLTASGVTVGTPAYMAPEQITAPRTVTAACDQYAVGAMLYEMLTARLPHEAETVPAIFVLKVDRACTPILRYRPKLNPNLAAVVMRTLELDPAARFADLEALRLALHASLLAPMPAADGTDHPGLVTTVEAPSFDPVARHEEAAGEGTSAPGATTPAEAPTPPDGGAPTGAPTARLPVIAWLLLPLVVIAALFLALHARPTPATARAPRSTAAAPVVAAIPAAVPIIAPVLAPPVAVPAAVPRMLRPASRAPHARRPAAATPHGRLPILDDNPFPR